MFKPNDLDFLKDPAIKINRPSRIPGMGIPLKTTFSAGIQTTGGIALAICTYKYSENRIWPFTCSAIAIGGILTVFTRIRKRYRRSTASEREQIWAAWNLATGTVLYITNVFAFSETLKRNDKLWFLCFQLAASGYHFAVSSINRLERAFSRKIFLKCCQKMFGPVLITCATTYLLNFRNHQEQWLRWFPLAVIAANGIKTTYHGFIRPEVEGDRKSLLLKWIEIVTGGCLIAGSCTILSIYALLNSYHYFWATCMTAMSLGGFYVINDSLQYLADYVTIRRYVFYSIAGVIIGSVVFWPASVLVISVGNPYELLHWFLFLVGMGHYIFWKAIHNLYSCLPWQRFYTTCQRVLGPVIIIDSSLAAAFISHRWGWRFALPAVFLVSFGIYTTCRGFRRKNRPS